MCGSWLFPIRIKYIQHSVLTVNNHDPSNASLLVPESAHSSMESTLFLRYNPLPSMPLCISTPLRATKLTNPNFSSNHSSLSLPNSSYQRPLRHAFSPVSCAINRFPEPSTNEEAGGDNKIVRGAIGVTLVLACVLGVISRGCTMSPKANAIASTILNQRRASSFQKLPIIYPAGGKVALQSLFDTTVYVSSRLAEPSKFRPWSTIKRPSAKDVKAIQVSFSSLYLFRHITSDNTKKYQLIKLSTRLWRIITYSRSM